MEVINNCDNSMKLGLLGDSSAGKTCIYLAFLDIEIPPDLLPTIGFDKYDKKIILENGKESNLIFGIQFRKKDFVHEI